MFEAFQIGASDFITKPLDLDVCAARVGAHIRVRDTARGVTAGSDGRTVLAERYELGDVIGTGTFGVVYRARHLILEDEVAVKLIHPDHARRPEGRARFQREAQAAWALRHPNAVAVLDFGIDGESTAYLVMELLEGLSLDEVISRGDTLPLERCIDIVMPVCDALEAAHALGIVHRDVKPSNIFLASRRGREQVKLLDFGIAELTAGSARLTLDGWVGTPTYMAPERFLSEPCDGRADVYSLGVVLYQLIAGRAPFVLDDYDPIALAMLHLRETPPPLGSLRADLPAALVSAVESAMAKRAADRPTASELRAALLDARDALSDDRGET
ncbi:MAG: protein kinase [Deltaproteobacteria bacterium]|nr:protein kinase [Deltaproteobacteria bacterium]